MGRDLKKKKKISFKTVLEKKKYNVNKTCEKLEY